MHSGFYVCCVHIGVVVGGGLGIRAKKHAAALLVGCDGSTLPG